MVISYTLYYVPAILNFVVVSFLVLFSWLVFELDKFKISWSSKSARICRCWFLEFKWEFQIKIRMLRSFWAKLYTMFYAENALGLLEATALLSEKHTKMEKYNSI